jgi:hypothetical protein
MTIENFQQADGSISSEDRDEIGRNASAVMVTPTDQSQPYRSIV